MRARRAPPKADVADADGEVMAAAGGPAMDRLAIGAMPRKPGTLAAPEADGMTGLEEIGLKAVVHGKERQGVRGGGRRTGWRPRAEP